MPGEMCIAELVHPVVTGAALAYIGSITIDQEALAAANLLPGEMVYIDDVDRKGPPWRTYIVPGERGKGDIINNGPPAYHFALGDHLTIRAGALISYADMPRLAGGHTKVYFEQGDDTPNRVATSKIERVEIPEKHLRKVCISKLHRIRVTKASTDGPEALIVDADILEAAGFPAGLEVQFTSLRDGALRRTCVQAGARGSGKAEVYGSGAWHIEAGTLLISLAEVWLPYEDAAKIGGPQVVFFDESVSDHNVIKEVKQGWRPS